MAHRSPNSPVYCDPGSVARTSPVKNLRMAAEVLARRAAKSCHRLPSLTDKPRMVEPWFIPRYRVRRTNWPGGRHAAQSSGSEPGVDNGSLAATNPRRAPGFIVAADRQPQLAVSKSRCRELPGAGHKWEARSARPYPTIGRDSRDRRGASLVRGGATPLAPLPQPQRASVAYTLRTPTHVGYLRLQTQVRHADAR